MTSSEYSLVGGNQSFRGTHCSRHRLSLLASRWRRDYTVS